MELKIFFFKIPPEAYLGLWKASMVELFEKICLAVSWICLGFLLTDPMLNTDYMTFVCVWIFTIYLKGVKFCESKNWLFCNFLPILSCK